MNPSVLSKFSVILLPFRAICSDSEISAHKSPLKLPEKPPILIIMVILIVLYSLYNKTLQHAIVFTNFRINSIISRPTTSITPCKKFNPAPKNYHFRQKTIISTKKPPPSDIKPTPHPIRLVSSKRQFFFYYRLYINPQP